MKKILIFLIIPLLTFYALSAQITQEQADQIVIERMADEMRSYSIYAKEDLQTGFEIITSIGEALELNYSCWVYYIDFVIESNSKYLIVKESNGNLLEINTKNDDGINEQDKWRVVPNINHSVWKCTKMVSSFPPGESYALLELSFYPSIGKLIVISDLLVVDEPLSGTYDYFIDEGVINSIPDLPFPSGMQFRIYSKSENEMVLQLGNVNPVMHYFICLTKFNDL